MKTIKVKLTEFDEKVLKHELLDIQEWIQLALGGKINSVKKRLVKESQDRLFSDPDVESVPASAEGVINLYLSKDYYKTLIKKRED